MEGYNPHKETISYFLTQVSKELDKQLGNYDNIFILGDFNASENHMNDSCEMYDLDNLISGPTCFKNGNNPSSIDVMLTNRKNSFQNSMTIETGLSDHHKMTVTVLKTYFKKKKPIKTNYRSYKYFNDSEFRNDLQKNLEITNKESIQYDEFNHIFMTDLDWHVPKKTKTVRGNNAPFMNKVLSKAFMHRSKLKNQYNKTPNEKNKSLYRKQRTFCLNLLRNEKKKYYNNLDLKKFEDNKQLWRRVKPIFSNKQNSLQNNIIIVEKDTIMSEDSEVAEKLNNFFIESVESLEIECFAPGLDDNIRTTNIDEIISKYARHPSILKIKENVQIEEKILFNNTSRNDFKRNICKLVPRKAGIENVIPTKILIGSGDIVCGYLFNIYNTSKEENKYPQSLKQADVTPIHKKEDRTLLKHYRPVSLIPIVSKLFERDMSNQILIYIDKFLSPYLFGYRVGHSTEQCLIIMIEVWKKAFDGKDKAGGILTDLSKVFDCLNHNLLIAKLEAYGFDHRALRFVYDYLKNRKQRTKVNSSYSSWRELKFGIPQGSILGPLLFNIFINDIFYFIKEAKMANYADDNAIYAVKRNLDNLLKTLEQETTLILNWFKVNEMKSNDDKCHLIICNQEYGSITLGSENIEESSSVELLGVNIDTNVNFNEHVTNLCKKANQKLHALARISKYLNEEKLNILMKTFIRSQFNYSPLVWMFHSRTLNNKINRLHERALRVVYKNENSSFQELVDKDNSITIH